MRIHLKIKTTQEFIPFNHQHLLTGTIHKWMGWNEEHGKMSLYSFSSLEKAKATPKGLHFTENAFMFISSYDSELLKKMIEKIQTGPNMFNGLKVNEIIMQENPNLSDKNIFFASSPIFIKRKIGDRVEHILYDDERANLFLKETLLNKMKQVGLTDDTLEIKFDLSYPKARTKKIEYKGVHNRASLCPVVINGKPETKLFAWNVGLGNSTGIGFGAIK